MNKVIGFGALAIGAYLLYEWYLSSQTAVAAGAAPVTPVTTPVTTTTLAPGSSAPVSTTTVATIPVDTTTLQSALVNAASVGYNSIMLGQGSGMQLNLNEWLYYYQQVTGAVVSPTQANAIASNLNIDPVNSLITVGDFIQGLQAMQTSGISGISGLGASGQPRLPGIRANVSSGQNIPYGVGVPGRPLSEGMGLVPANSRASYGFNAPMDNGMGRVYLSGFGTIGQGYGINETYAGDASFYEMVPKYVM